MVKVEYKTVTVRVDGTPSAENVNWLLESTLEKEHEKGRWLFSAIISNSLGTLSLLLTRNNNVS